MQVGVSKAFDMSITETPFSFVESKVVEFAHNKEVIPEVCRLDWNLEYCRAILQISKPKSDEVAHLTPILCDSSRDAIYTLLSDQSMGDNFRFTLNAALIFNSNFPVKFPNNIQCLGQVLRYSDASQSLTSDVRFAGKILPDPLHSNYFVPTLASLPGVYQDWVHVIPNFEFEVEREFNLIRLVYALQRDFFTAYKDEMFQCYSCRFCEIVHSRLEDLRNNCITLFTNLTKPARLQHGLEKMREEGKIPQIAPNHFVGLVDEMNKRLLSSSNEYAAAEEFIPHKFNRVLSDAEMQFLPTCLCILEPIAKIKESESVMIADMKEFREKSSTSSDLYAFKANKLESALITLNRLWMFREVLLRPCEIKSLSLVHEFEAKVNHMEFQFASELHKHEAELRKRDEEIELMKQQIFQLFEKVNFDK